MGLVTEPGFISATGKRTVESLVDNARTTLPPSSGRSASCLAVSNVGPYFAVGCSVKKSNLHVFENTTPPVPRRFPSGSGGHESLTYKTCLSIPSPIYSLSWSGDYVVIGGAEGKAYLYKVNYADLKGSGDNAFDYVSKCVFFDDKARSAAETTSLPGSYITTSRIQHVALNPPPILKQSLQGLESKPASPTSSSPLQSTTTNESNWTPISFLAVEGRRIHLWDLRDSRVTQTGTIGKGSLFTASWSPHEGAIGKLIATGGSDGTAHIVDTRLFGNGTGSNNASVWKVPNCHSPSLTDIQWSPFIPYWVATAGEDSVVNVWDIRYARGPVSKIPGHYHSISSIAWSNTHIDVIATTSFDKSVKIWNISSDIAVPKADPSERPPPPRYYPSSIKPTEYHVGATAISNYESGENSITGFIKVLPSPTHINSFYSLTGTGEVYSHTISGECLHNYGQYHHNPETEPLLHEFEKSIQMRDLGNAYMVLKKMSSKRDGLSLSEINNFLKYVQPKPPIESSTWNIPSTSSQASPSSISNPTSDLARSSSSPSLVITQQWSSNDALDQATETPPSSATIKPTDSAPGTPSQSRRVFPKFTTQQNEETELKQLLKEKEMMESFKKILDEWTYGLPPAFGSGLNSALLNVAVANNKADIEAFLMKINLQNAVNSGKLDGLPAAEKTICRSLESGSSHWDGDALRAIIESTLMQDPLRALFLGFKFSATVQSQPKLRFADCMDMIYLMLYPTVYDSENVLNEFEDAVLVGKVHKAKMNAIKTKSGKKLPSMEPLGPWRQAVASCFENDKLVLPMVKLEIALYKLLSMTDGGGSNNSNATKVSDEDIIQIMHGASSANPTSMDGSSTFDLPSSTSNASTSTNERTISVLLNKFYLDALINLKRFDEYFAVVSDLMVRYGSFDYSKRLIYSLTYNALPQLKIQVVRLCEDASESMISAYDSSPVTAQPKLTATAKTVKDSYVNLLKCTTILYVTLEKLWVTAGATDSSSISQSGNNLAVPSHIITLRDTYSQLLEYGHTLMNLVMKVLETMEKVVGRSGTNPTKEVGQMVLNGLKDGVKPFMSQIDSKTTGKAGVTNVLVELNTFLEKLAKFNAIVPTQQPSHY